MEAIAHVYGVPVIDFVRDYDRTVPKHYFNDVIHQSPDGNKRVAEYVSKAIGSYLLDPTKADTASRTR
jgi:hypothetical protein